VLPILQKTVDPVVLFMDESYSAQIRKVAEQRPSLKDWDWETMSPDWVDFTPPEEIATTPEHYYSVRYDQAEDHHWLTYGVQSRFDGGYSYHTLAPKATISSALTIMLQHWQKQQVESLAETRVDDILTLLADRPYFKDWEIELLTDNSVSFASPQTGQIEYNVHHRPRGYTITWFNHATGEEERIGAYVSPSHALTIMAKHSADRQAEALIDEELAL
jgi:hypothetical protein